MTSLYQGLSSFAFEGGERDPGNEVVCMVVIGEISRAKMQASQGERAGARRVWRSSYGPTN